MSGQLFDGTYIGMFSNKTYDVILHLFLFVRVRNLSRLWDPIVTDQPWLLHPVISNYTGFAVSIVVQLRAMFVHTVISKFCVHTTQSASDADALVDATRAIRNAEEGFGTLHDQRRCRTYCSL